MKAATLIGKCRIDVQELPPPVPANGEVLVRVTQVGVCGTDVHLYRGSRPISYPLVLGHEGQGTVVACGGKASESLLGKRVVIEPNFPCGICRHCAQGRGNICADRRSLGVTEHGCLADFVCVPERFAWPIPDVLTDDQALLIEPAAIAVHALKASGTQPGATVAVIGLGTVGLLLAQLAARLGHQVLATDVNPRKCRRAASFGVTILDCSDTDELAEQWRAAGVECIFECAGAPMTATLALSAAPGGAAIVLVGLSECHASFSPLKLVRQGISIVPSMIYDHPDDFSRTLQLFTARVIDPTSLISGRYPLSAANHALAEAGEADHIKLVIDVGTGAGS